MIDAKITCRTVKGLSIEFHVTDYERYKLRLDQTLFVRDAIGNGLAVMHITKIESTEIPPS